MTYQENQFKNPNYLSLSETLSYLALEEFKKHLVGLEYGISIDIKLLNCLMFRNVNFVEYYYYFLFGESDNPNKFYSIRGTDELEHFINRKLNGDYTSVKSLYKVFLDQELDCVKRATNDIEKMIEKGKFLSIVHSLFWRESKYVGEKLSLYNTDLRISDIPLLPKDKIDSPRAYLNSINKEVTEQLVDIIHDAIGFIMIDFNADNVNALKPEEESIKKIIRDHYLLANK
jgi:hypothetical protein